MRTDKYAAAPCAELRGLGCAGGAAALAAALLLWTAGCGPRKPLESFWELPDFRITVVSPGFQGEMSKQDFLGAPWIADFIFTRCEGPCPILSARMAELQRQIPEAVRLVSFSVDPGYDTPAVLEAYARRFGASPRRWLFATGEKGPLLKLYQNGFKLAAAADPNAPSGYRIIHSTKFVLVDAGGNVRGYYDGDRPEELERLSAAALQLQETVLPPAASQAR